jgi:hypothetical protein
MAQVLVRNKNTHPYRERFRDRLIEIPAGQTIEMDADEAKHFVAKCNGIKRDGDGQPDPTGFKRLFIEPIAGQKAETEPAYVSNIDGKTFATKRELDAHLEQFKDKVFTDENAEREIEARKVGRPRKTPGAA